MPCTITVLSLPVVSGQISTTVPSWNLCGELPDTELLGARLVKAETNNLI